MSVGGLVRVRWVLGVLLVAAAALFAFGIGTEGDVHHRTTGASSIEREASESSESGEAGEPSGAPVEGRAVAETGERVLGVNLESTPLVALAVAASIVLAVVTWRRGDPWLLVVTAVFAAGFSVLDVAEFSHQLARPAAMLAAVAAIIAVLHALAAFVAERRRHLAA